MFITVFFSQTALISGVPDYFSWDGVMEKTASHATSHSTPKELWIWSGESHQSWHFLELALGLCVPHVQMCMHIWRWRLVAKRGEAAQITEWQITVDFHGVRSGPAPQEAPQMKG